MNVAMPTLFERIIAGEIPSYKIYEDDTVFAFLDINPSQKGHTLVVTKRPYENILVADDAHVAYAFLMAKKIAVKMKEVLGCPLVNIVVEGLEVPHFHIHVIPMIEGQKNAQWHHIAYEEGEMDSYKEKLQIK